jgi:tetratricopeptide (TPR) repeat protein
VVVVADFDPRQLDALEDALEDLEVDADLADLALAPELLERLAEYQQVLALTRDAFPLDDPPEGLLDGVLAEAREVARNAPVPTPELRGGWRQTWARWRSSLVPFAALAGAGVLVLWIARPGDDTQLAKVDRSATNSDATAKSEERSPGEPAASQTRERDSAEAAGSASEAEDAPVELVEAPEPEPVSAEPTAKQSPKPTKQKTSGAGAGAASVPAVAPDPIAPLSKEDTWSDLERADAARRKGDCDRARTIYDKVIAAASQSNAIAQAKAGIGLCFEQDGKSSKATLWFDDARANNPGIDAWIRAQRDDQPLPGEKKKSKANEAYEDLDSL